MKFGIKAIQYFFILVLMLLPAAHIYDQTIDQLRFMHEDRWAEKLTIGDQHGIYVTYKDFKTKQGVPYGIENGWVGIGYLASIEFFHKLSSFWKVPEVDYTFLYNGFFYCLLSSIILFIFMYRVSRHQEDSFSKITTAILCAIYIIIFYQLSTLLKFSWIPWSHYAAAFFGLSFILFAFEFAIKASFLSAIGIGFFGTIFLLARRHEAVAVFVACLCSIALYCIPLFRAKEKFFWKKSLKLGSWVVVGLLISIMSIKLLTNNLPFNSHYEQQRQSNTYVHEYLKLYPKMAFLRTVQTFFDPNYYSYGNDYEIKRISNAKFGTDTFAMPMIYQIPFLFYLVPVCFFALGFFYIKKKLYINRWPPAFLALCFGVSIFSAITMGYFSTAVWGGTHLKNGLVREFILSGLVLMAAAGPGLYLMAFSSRKYFKILILPIVGMIFLGNSLGQDVLLDQHSKNPFGNHMQPAKGSYECTNGHCKVSMRYFDMNGNAINPPFDETIVRFYCDSGIEGKPLALGEAGITLNGPEFSFDIIKCPEPVLISVYPLFFGYAGSGQPSLEFKECPSKELSPNCLPAK